ncbi:MAG: ATP-binding protein [Candidatus Gastranaerophilales bacterium]|nr:ATP-binding protein [Candidatus Gastranaerophilales bacterium]
MEKILLITQDDNLTQKCSDVFVQNDYKFELAKDKQEIDFVVTQFAPDVVLVDMDFDGVDVQVLCNNLKLYSQSDDIQLLLITDGKKILPDALSRVDGYVVKPFSNEVLLSSVNAHLRTKKRLDMIFSKTSELARSLYQLNVMYDTSSQLAGTLDKQKLIDVMREGFERSISFAMCAILLVSDDDVTLVINSLHPVSERLEAAIKLRMMLNYKNLFHDRKCPFDFNIDDIQVSKASKHSDGNFDIKIVDFDTLFSPISTADNFFGMVEVFRDEKFSQEDATCFQTLVKQVSLPLESANLYEELQNTNKKLEKLEQLKSEFISIVSHELRTPLTAIKNSLKIILSGKSGELPAPMANFLNMASRNVTRLSGIINDLLDLSKIEAGKMDFRFEKFNAKTSFEDVYATFLASAQEKNINLNLDLSQNLDDAYGDLDRIEQVLSNLVSNAVKFTPEEGEIKISAKDATDEEIKKCNPALKGGYVKISVKDTGIGIAADDLPKVFDKFQQIESALVRKVGGTGLGLSIARQLVEAHRGCIWVDSEVGLGSEFSFLIPTATEENIFILEIDKLIQNAKQNHAGLALVEVLEEGGQAFIDEFVGNSNIVTKYDKARIFTQSSSNSATMHIVLPDANKMALDILLQKIKELIISQNFTYNIKLGGVIYPDDAINSDELLQRVAENLIELV